MFNTAKSLALAAGVSMLALTGANAQEMVKISVIDVETSYAAAEDSNAAQKFPEISEDIRAAIAERVGTSDDAGDPSIHVDIRKIALDGDTFIPDSAEFNQIEGVVDIRSPDGEIGAVSFPVMVSATTEATALPEGWVQINPSTEDFYNVMVEGFANVVAENLANVNTAGDGISK
jgi:hypothetical protein